MMQITANEIKALHLLSANGDARTYSSQCHATINANVKGLLAKGLIDYAPGRKCGYKLTAAGKAVKAQDDK